MRVFSYCYVCIVEIAEEVSTVNAVVTVKNMNYSDALADTDSLEFINISVLFCSEVYSFPCFWRFYDQR